MTAVRVDDAWDADIRIRRTFSEDKPHVEVVNMPQADGDGGRGARRGLCAAVVDRHSAAESAEGTGSRNRPCISSL